MTCTTAKSQHMTYREYVSQYSKFLLFYKEWFRQKLSIGQAIQTVYRQPDGSFHPHQHAHGNYVSEGAVKNALRSNVAKLLTAANFEELYDVVKASIGGIQYVGDVTVYDVALRIGFHRGITPDKYVYLHAGAKKGYKKITGEARVSYRVLRGSLPEGLRDKPAYLLEDYFCYASR